MKISTTRFGTIEVLEKEIIHMPNGMIGFPDERQFILLKHAEGSPFLWFQSIKSPGLAFVVLDPFILEPHYEFNLLEEDKKDLRLKENSNGIQALVVINISHNGQSLKITANLLAPIIINIEERTAKQVILFNSPYSHRHPVPINNDKKTNPDSPTSVKQ